MSRFIVIYETLIQKAAEFHGHLGPYLVLGLKADLVMIEKWGREPFKTKALVKTNTKPPKSCFIDGIQFSSGCTMGKGNITVKESNDISVSFHKGSERIEVKVRDEVIRELNRDFSAEELEEMALKLFGRKDEDIFEVKTGE